MKKEPSKAVLKIRCSCGERYQITLTEKKAEKMNWEEDCRECDCPHFFLASYDKNTKALTNFVVVQSG
jgi:hypothetical protein